MLKSSRPGIMLKSERRDEKAEAKDLEYWNIGKPRQIEGFISLRTSDCQAHLLPRRS